MLPQVDRHPSPARVDGFPVRAIPKQIKLFAAVISVEEEHRPQYSGSVYQQEDQRNKGEITAADLPVPAVLQRAIFFFGGTIKTLLAVADSLEPAASTRGA